jgi:hypothetical protein
VTWKTVRDGVIFFVGIAGVAHETLASGDADPTLLLLFASMIGLPAFLHKDERD